jgi:hypothetical protein
MKNMLLLLTILVMRCSLLAQQPEEQKKENFRIKVRQIQNGQQIMLDTTFQSREQMEFFIKSQGMKTTLFEGHEGDSQRIVLVNKRIEHNNTNGGETRIQNLDSVILITEGMDTINLNNIGLGTPSVKGPDGNHRQILIEERLDSTNGEVRKIREVHVVVKMMVKDLEPSEKTVLYRSNKVRDLELSNFDIQPNPASATTYISFTAPGNEAILRIYESSGRMVTEQKIYGESGKFEHTINVGDMVSGTYFIQVVQGQKYFTKKLVIGE